MQQKCEIILAYFDHETEMSILVTEAKEATVGTALSHFVAIIKRCWASSESKLTFQCHRVKGGETLHLKHQCSGKFRFGYEKVALDAWKKLNCKHCG